MPRLLDLFCGAGGCSMGYAQAGFEVVGVDLHPQPRYPFPFIQADAMTFPLEGFDAIHASPPCQSFTRARVYFNKPHADLLIPTLERFRALTIPWVVENVQGAPVPNPICLCGTMFGLPLYRHRLFTSNTPLDVPVHPHHPHELLPGYVCIYGHTVRGRETGKYGNHSPKYDTATGQAAMGTPWMIKREMGQAIPPAYTHYLGQQLLTYLEGTDAISTTDTAS